MVRQEIYQKGFAWQQIYDSIQRNWFDILLLTIVLVMAMQKNISIELAYQDVGQVATITNPQAPSSMSILPAVNVSHNQDKTETRLEAPATKAKRIAPHINNLTFVLSPTYAERHHISEEIVVAKMDVLYDYVHRYAIAAQDEMRDNGILASITLAQGLLESNAGESLLATQSNNHFGIKCRRKCRGCTCRNYRDDSIYDMFRVFDSVADSYREHSILLSGDRYKHLKNYGKNYRQWAHGLKKAGYATDKRYAEKLIQIIEGLSLDRYDQI